MIFESTLHSWKPDGCGRSSRGHGAGQLAAGTKWFNSPRGTLSTYKAVLRNRSKRNWLKPQRPEHRPRHRGTEQNLHLANTKASQSVSSLLAASKDIPGYFRDAVTGLDFFVSWLYNPGELFYLSELLSWVFGCLLFDCHSASHFSGTLGNKNRWRLFYLCSVPDTAQVLDGRYPVSPPQDSVVIILLPPLEITLLFRPWHWLYGNWGTSSVESNLFMVSRVCPARH